MIVPPCLIFPACSAASSIAMPMRSFTLPPGLRYSSFASIVGRNPCAIRLSRTRGVLPITSRMVSCHISFSVGPTGQVIVGTPLRGLLYWAFGRSPHAVLRYHKQFLHPGLHTRESLHGRRHWKVADVHLLHAALYQSMHAARADLFGMNVCGKVARQFIDGNRKELREHRKCLRTGASVIENAEDSRNLYA